MIVFNITFTIVDDALESWLIWAKSNLIKLMHEFPFEEKSFMRLLNKNSEGQSNYTFQLKMKALPTFPSTLQMAQDKVIKEMIELFPEKVLCFCTVLKEELLK